VNVGKKSKSLFMINTPQHGAMVLNWLEPNPRIMDCVTNQLRYGYEFIKNISESDYYLDLGKGSDIYIILYQSFVTNEQVLGNYLSYRQILDTDPEQLNGPPDNGIILLEKSIHSNGSQGFHWVDHITYMEINPYKRLCQNTQSL
jgi:hypothetical protein